MKRFLLYTLYTLFTSHFLPAQPPIGFWREHLPFHSTIDVMPGDGKIYAATPLSVFIVDDANEVTRLSKVMGLSETGVSKIGFDESTGKFLVAYTNSNLDIIYRGDIFNIPDIKRDNIVGDKKIYSVYAKNGDFFLSTGLGVIVINGSNYEVKSNWFIGSGGSQLKVTGFTSDANNYYAATEEGLKRVSLNSDPANYLNWQLLSGTNGLPPGSAKNVLNAQNRIIVQKNDSLFISNNNNWTLFFTETDWHIQNVNSSGGKVLVSQKKNDGSSRVVVLNVDGSISTVLIYPLITDPRAVVIMNNDHYVADSIGGLTKFMPSGFINFRLNSPHSVTTGETRFANNRYYATGGGVDDSWVKQSKKGEISSFGDGQWTNYTRENIPALDTVTDLVSIAIDPSNGSIWAGSFGGGLFHIGSSIEVFKQNSLLGQAINEPGSYRVAGLAFDNSQDLWISNYGSTRPVVVRKKNGTWKTLAPPFALTENATAIILIDDLQQKWIISPKNGLLVLDNGNTVDNEADDRWKLFRAGQGLGNLPSNNVLSLAKDKNGFIWVGTDDGIGIFQCISNVFSSPGCEAFLPIVQQGGFNSFLFKGEKVRAIAVDGADRKWIGTDNGAWLVNAEGDKVIFHFSIDNSPLPSNKVHSISIDPYLGEVYFETDKGIVSFRSTATEGSETNKNVLVFPNPVPPAYEGTIAIRGLVNDSHVKITELNGRLVFQTRALGGQAVWNGRDYQGRKISSGVYLVIVSDETRKERMVTKIVFISSRTP